MLLRPELTKQLADTLLAGKHVNLVSPHGRGRRRTLEDLKTLLPYGVLVQQIDLKRQQNMWKTWLEYTLSLSGQVVIIIHNIEYINESQRLSLQALKKFTLLCVSELPLSDKDLEIITLLSFEESA